MNVPTKAEDEELKCLPPGADASFLTKKKKKQRKRGRGKAKNVKPDELASEGEELSGKEIVRGSSKNECSVDSGNQDESKIAITNDGNADIPHPPIPEEVGDNQSLSETCLSLNKSVDIEAEKFTERSTEEGSPPVWSGRTWEKATPSLDQPFAKSLGNYLGKWSLKRTSPEWGPKNGGVVSVAEFVTRLRRVFRNQKASLSPVEKAAEFCENASNCFHQSGLEWTFDGHCEPTSAEPQETKASSNALTLEKFINWASSPNSVLLLPFNSQADMAGFEKIGFRHFPALALHNLPGSNICFANAVIQLLFSSQALLTALVHQVKPLMPEKSSLDLNAPAAQKWPVTYDLAGVAAKLLDQENETIVKGISLLQWCPGLNRAWKQACNSGDVGSQEDACEFLQFILERISLELGVTESDNVSEESFSVVGKKGRPLRPYKQTLVPGKNLISMIKPLFGGSLLHEISRRGDKTPHRQSVEPFVILSLPSGHFERDLGDLFDAFFAPQTLGEEKRSSVPGRETLMSRLLFQVLPPILFVQIKRFGYETATASVVKIQRTIVVPAFLKIKPEWMSDTLKLGHDQSSVTYELKGVISHLGSRVFSGHYLTRIKRNNKWYLCDDTLIREEDEGLSGLSTDTWRDGYAFLYQLTTFSPYFLAEQIFV